MVEDHLRFAIEAIQGIIIGLIILIFYNNFIKSFPDSILFRPLELLAIFLNGLPWIFAVLAVLALLTMLVEVVDL